jgi:hypothetical protein
MTFMKASCGDDGGVRSIADRLAAPAVLEA